MANYIETPGKQYQVTHPWITFQANLKDASMELWLLLGECCSKCEHLAGVPLQPATAQRLHTLYLAKGVHGTTAIEGNTLSEKEVLERLEGGLNLPPSRAYLQTEIDNVIEACNIITRKTYLDGMVKLTVERIKEFNRLVLKGLELEAGMQAGIIPRKVIGVAGYRGAPREDCEYLLERLCNWLDKGFEMKEPLGLGVAFIKAVLAHLYFEWIHPFADGNGRTGRLIEFQILNASGIPAPASHVLSNFYNQTRSEYYKQLDYASKSGGKVVPFLLYAIRGLRDGLREQIEVVRRQQIQVTWTNYVHEQLGGRSGQVAHRQKELVLALSNAASPVPFSKVTQLNPKVALAYATKTTRTLIRDMAELEQKKLLVRAAGGWAANTDTVLAWLPKRLDVSEPGPIP